ncbi:MAG TPA: hypothetical protein VIV12_15430 [Streptosporangiaceae bacterium]
MDLIVSRAGQRVVDRAPINGLLLICHGKCCRAINGFASDRSVAAISRGGGNAQWERQLAAERREAERQARERAKWEKELENARKQRHLESQQRAAEAKTAGVERQVKVLDEMLTSILPLAPLSFDRIMVTPETPRFRPGSLGIAPPTPDWSQYAPMSQAA